MATSNEFLIMKNCRIVMNHMGLCNVNNVQTFGSKFRIIIPIWMIRFVYTIPMCICVILSVLHVIDKNLNLTASSVALIVIVGGSQSHVIYLLLIAKNNPLTDIINQLQKLIDKRKCLWLMGVFHFLLFFNRTLFVGEQPKKKSKQKICSFCATYTTPNFPYTMSRKLA